MNLRGGGGRGREGVGVGWVGLGLSIAIITAIWVEISFRGLQKKKRQIERDGCR